VGRRIFPFEPTWLDRRFQKAFSALHQEEQKRRRNELAALIKALKACTHPSTDPSLRPFRPSSYKGVARVPGQLIEYRLPGLFRVIVCYFSSDPVSGTEERILLVAATLTHNHDRLQRLIRQHRGGITTDYEPEPGEEDPPREI
jgi:hypothetical protein